MQDWLNRIGLTLQFVALFLVTPEILGKEKIAALAKIWNGPLDWLGNHLSRRNIVGIGTGLLVGGTTYYTNRVNKERHAGFAGSFWGILIFVVCLVAVVWTIQYPLSWTPILVRKVTTNPRTSSWSELFCSARASSFSCGQRGYPAVSQRAYVIHRPP